MTTTETNTYVRVKLTRDQAKALETLICAATTEDASPVWIMSEPEPHSRTYQAGNGVVFSLRPLLDDDTFYLVDQAGEILSTALTARLPE